MSLSIGVSVVLHESAADIADCLSSVAGRAAPDDVVVLDNASTDDGAAVAQGALRDACVIRSVRNLGFAGGQNHAISHLTTDLVLVLNPDCRIAPDFLATAIAAFEADPGLGAMSGRLLRFRPNDPSGGPLTELNDDVLDSTGLVGLRNRRVLDRGSEEPGAGRYRHRAFVFGASGAAAVYRRTMLEDVAFEGEIFDERFFAYREDVDIAWRAQLLGWRCLYEPTALARHWRRVTPTRRRSLPAWINRRSVANRWRMLLKNETVTGWRRDGAAILARDAQILGYSLLREWTTLPAVTEVTRDLPRLRAQHLDLMRRRRADEAEVADWFGRVDERPSTPPMTALNNERMSP